MNGVEISPSISIGPLGPGSLSGGIIGIGMPGIDVSGLAIPAPAFTAYQQAILDQMAAAAAASSIRPPTGQPSIEAILEGAEAPPLPLAPPPPVSRPPGEIPFVDFPTVTGPGTFTPLGIPIVDVPGEITAREAVILDEMERAAEFPTTPTGQMPTFEAILEGAAIPRLEPAEQVVIRPTTEAPGFLPLPPLPDGGGVPPPLPPDGGPTPGGDDMAELPDVLVAMARAAGQIWGSGPSDFGLPAMTGGGGTGALGITGPWQTAQAQVQLPAQMPNGNGAFCPPPRPRMPSAVLAPNPCNPRNPTVYLKAGPVSSGLFPQVLKSQTKRARKVAQVVRRPSSKRRRK